MKRIFSVIICVLITAAAIVTAHAEIVVPDKTLTYVTADVYIDAKTAAGPPKAGDINMDKEIDNKDVVALFRNVSGVAGKVDETAADCNGDGAVDNKDVVVLFRFVSGSVTELKYGTVELPGPVDLTGFSVAANDKLSKWFSDKTELDPVTWEVIAPAGFDSVSEFVVRRARGQYIEEVTVLKVAKGGSVEDVKAMADFRCNKEKNNADYTLYDDDDHRNAKMLDKGVVEVIGGFVVYIVTEDTETSVLRAKKFVKDNPDCTAVELYKAIVIEEYPAA